MELHGLTECVARFHITDEKDEEEDEGFVFADKEKARSSLDLRWALVGWFLTERFIRLNEMSQVMAMNCQPGKGVFIQEIAPQLFIFQFAHEVGIRRVTEDGQWAYDNHLLLYKRIQPNENPEHIILDQVALWVQVHDLPLSFLSECIAQGIATRLGMFMSSDPNNYAGSWRTYLRIRVSIDVNKPLKKSLKIKPERGQSVMATLKYERLPTFCFLCGEIGHSEKFCHKQYENAEGIVVRKFGPELRASSKRSSQLDMGAKWLLQMPAISETKTEQLPATEGRNIGDSGSLAKNKGSDCCNGEITGNEKGSSGNQGSSILD